MTDRTLVVPSTVTDPALARFLDDLARRQAGVGETGPQGPPGQDGQNGATGPTGSTGQDGADGAIGPAGPGLPSGGTTGQLVKKASGTDYDTIWFTIAKADVGLGNVDNTSDSSKNAAAATLTNKTIALGSNTITGTKAEFDAACTDYNFSYVNFANTFTEPQIFTHNVAGGVPITIFTNEDSAISAPNFIFHRVSASPAANDAIGGIQWKARNSAAADVLYGQFIITIVDPTSGSEDSRIDYYLQKAGVNTLALSITADGFSMPVSNMDFDVAGPAEFTNTLTVDDVNFILRDNADVTCKAEFKLDALPGGSTHTFSFPATAGILVTIDATQTLSGKSIDLATNTVTGTLAQLNTAITDANIASLAGVETLTNKTLTAPAISSPTGLVKGDVGLGNVDNTSDATKNAASVTLTNKTIALGSNTISGTLAQLNTAVTDADLVPTGALFSVHRNGTDQTGVATATWTKVAFTNEETDSHSFFDNATNYRFLPTVAGRYLISAGITFASLASGSLLAISIYKNGARYKDVLTTLGVAGDGGTTISFPVSFNGSSDYVEIFVLHTSGVNKTIYGNTNLTWMSGVWVGPT